VQPSSASRAQIARVRRARCRTFLTRARLGALCGLLLGFNGLGVRAADLSAEPVDGTDGDRATGVRADGTANGIIDGITDGADGDRATGVRAAGTVNGDRVDGTDAVDGADGADGADGTDGADGAARIGEAEPTDPAAPETIPEARLGFGGELRVGAAVHQPALSIALVGDYTWRRAALGVGVEVNPYLGVGAGDGVAGSLNIFATAEHRVPLGRVTLRQRVSLGPAVLLADVLGHGRGSLGLFLEAVPLGLEIQTRVRRVAVTLEAFSLALSAPALAASEAGDPPLVRPQYRAAVGLRF